MIGNMGQWRCTFWRVVRSRVMWAMTILVLMLSVHPPYLYVTATATLSIDASTCLQLSEPHCISKLTSSFVVVPLRQPLSTQHQQQHQTIQSSIHGGGVIALEFWKRANSDHEANDDNLSKGMNFSPSDDESYDNESPSPETEFGSLFDDFVDSGNVPTMQSNATDILGIDANFSVTINIANTTTSTKRNRWKRLTLPPSVGALLPGKPLFMRLVPKKSVDIVSKIMDEIQPQEDKADWFKLLEQERSTGHYLNLSDVEFMSLGNGTHQLSSISSSANAPLMSEHAEGNDTHDHKRSKRRFFQRNFKNISDGAVKVVPQLSKDELECPFIASNIDDLQTAVLLNKIPLRDVGFRFPIKGVGSEVIFGQQTAGDERKQSSIDITNSPLSSGGETAFHRHDPIINGSLSSLLTYKAKTSSDPTLLANYHHGIELLSHHPVLSLVRERVLSKSKPGRRVQGSNSPSADIPHLALVIEGGGMRGAVSAGMAAALSTLDLLDAFDSIHGSSAGSIVGAYLVSRQLCMDVYTDIMPASGNKFVSKRGGLVNFGVDWLGDLIQRKLLTFDGEEQDGSSGTDDLCVDVSGADGENVTSWVCEDDEASSVELAMGTSKRKQSGDLSRSTRLQSDDQYGGIVVESMNYLLSNMFHVAKSSVSKPLLFGARRFGRAIRPAISALDVASSMRQYLRRRPGMNITYVLDGVMDESHGLRPFDVHAFQANDKLQPLYMIASTVSNGGKGEMETGKAQIVMHH